MIRVKARGLRGRGSREKRPRRVAIAEVGLENKFAYALEIERTNQEHSILVLAREDSQRIVADEVTSDHAYVCFEARMGARRATTGISTSSRRVIAATVI